MVRKLPRVTSRDSRQQAPSSTTTPLLAQRFIVGVISFWRTQVISIARCKCKKISSPSKIQVWWLVFFFANDLFVHVFDSFSMSLSTSRTTARKPRPSQTLSGSANTAACTQDAYFGVEIEMQTAAKITATEEWLLFLLKYRDTSHFFPVSQLIFTSLQKEI